MFCGSGVAHRSYACTKFMQSEHGISVITMPQHTPSQRILVKVLILLALSAGMYSLSRMLLASSELVALGESWLPSSMVAAVPLFILAGALANVLGMPRQVIAIIGGFAFGTLSGTLLTLVTVMLSSGALFVTARRLGRRRLERRFPMVIEIIERFGKDRVFAATLAIRLLPIGSNLVTSSAAGAAGLPPIPFFAASLLGFLPKTIVFVLAGQGVANEHLGTIVFAVLLLIVSTIVGVRLMRTQ